MAGTHRGTLTGMALQARRAAGRVDDMSAFMNARAGHRSWVCAVLVLLLLAVLSLTGTVANAYGSSGSTTENRVKASNAAVFNGVGAGEHIPAGQRRGEAVPQQDLAQGRGVHTYYVLAGQTPVLVHNCDPAALDDAGEAYVRNRHFQSGPRFDDSKGAFNDDVDLYRLADESNNFPATQQANGNCARVCDAGRPVGREAARDGGAPTSEYTVITDKYGGVVTMHPGRPR